MNFYFKTIDAFIDVEAYFRFHVFNVELFSVNQIESFNIEKVCCCLIIVTSRLLYDDDVVF